MDSQIEDEISALGRTFNRMTEQLQNQRNGLVEANRQLDERRQFTETVLAGVSAGVIGLDSEGKILLHNKSATKLLNIELHKLIGKNFRDVVPEMEKLLTTSMQNSTGISHGEINYIKDSRQMTLVVSIAVEQIDQEIIGYVGEQA